MATSDGFLCGVCEYQNITIPAEHWCPECDEGLCSSCENHHRSSRLSRKHGVMSIENYKKLPSGVVKVTNHCEEHSSKYQNYCPRHDKLCCPICISTTHKECIGLLAIEEIIETSKMTSLLDNMEDTLKCMDDNISSIMQNRADNLSLIREQRDRHRDNIAEIRKSVIFHLDALEGQKLWVFEDKSAVLCPLGVDVDVDGNGNVYVASNYNHRVMVLSPDGKKFRQLLGDDDGLWNPSAINIDVNSRKLLVFNYSGKAFLYKIS